MPENPITEDQAVNDLNQSLDNFLIPQPGKGKSHWPKGKIAAIVLIATLGIGGAGFYGIRTYVSHVAQKTEVEVKSSLENQRKVKSDALSFMSQTHTSEEIENKLVEAFASLDETDRTELVDTYLYGIYNVAAQYSLTDVQTNEILASCINQDGTTDFSKLEDEELKKQIEELEPQHVVLKYLNGSLFWDADYKYFDETFGSYVREDYGKLIHFYSEEKQFSYCDESQETLYPEIVENRLKELYSLLCTYPDSDIYDIINESYLFYKAVFLGAYSQDYIFADGEVKPEILERYRSFADATQDEDLRLILTELLSDYAAVNNVKTVPIMEKIKEFCEFYQK